jgi:DNA-binding MarR family transcriptional regulator
MISGIWYDSTPKALRLLPTIKPLEPETLRCLARLDAGLTSARSIVGRYASVRLIQTLIDVGEHPDTTRTELAGRVRMPLTTASQDLRTLSTERRDGTAGLGLIEARWDAMDVRLLRYRCTPSGQAALVRLNAAMEEGS